MNSSKFQKEVLDRLDEIISLLKKEEKPQVKKVLVGSPLTTIPITIPTTTTNTTTNPIGSKTITLSPDGSHPIPPKGYKLVPDGYHYEYNSDTNEIEIVKLGNKIN